MPILQSRAGETLLLGIMRMPELHHPGFHFRKPRREGPADSLVMRVLAPPHKRATVRVFEILRWRGTPERTCRCHRGPGISSSHSDLGHAARRLDRGRVYRTLYPCRRAPVNPAVGELVAHLCSYSGRSGCVARISHKERVEDIEPRLQIV